MSAGIYKFTNKINKKVYIGSSITIEERYKEHIRKTNPNIKLRRAIKKYGLDNFYFEVLEKVDTIPFITLTELNTKLVKREQYYLDLYYAQEFIRSHGKDKRFKTLTYNSNPTAGGNEGRVYTESSKRKMSKIHKERGISVGDKNPNFGKKTSLEKINKIINTFKQNHYIVWFYKITPTLDIGGPFENLRKYSKETGLIRRGITLCLNGDIRQYKGNAYCLKDNLENKLQEIYNNPKYWIQIRKKYRNEQVSAISE